MKSSTSHSHDLALFSSLFFKKMKNKKNNKKSQKPKSLSFINDEKVGSIHA